MNSPLRVALYVALIAWWIILQPIAWDLGWQSVYLAGALGALLLIVSENHRHGSRMAVPYRLYGLLIVGGTLMPASFYGFQQEMRRWHSYGYYRRREIPAFAEMAMFLIVAAALVAFAFLLRPFGADADKHPLARLVEVARRQWVPFGLVLAMGLMAILGYVGEPAPLISTLIANAAMLAFSVWLMHVGLREERGPLFSAGVIYFLAWSVCRYSDLFGDFGGMLGAAMMFALCGAALFGLAIFWGKRKELRHAG